MSKIDYPKVKEEIIEMHNKGDSLEKIDETINKMYDFTVNGMKADMLPVCREVIHRYQQ